MYKCFAPLIKILLKKFGGSGFANFGHVTLFAKFLKIRIWPPFGMVDILILFFFFFFFAGLWLSYIYTGVVKILCGNSYVRNGKILYFAWVQVDPPLCTNGSEK